jgi:hypothetical protein
MAGAILGWPVVSSAVRAAEPDAADKRIVQTVQRMASFDYAKANGKTKEAIGRYLEATAGSAEYFQLVEKFRVTGERDRLVALAVGQAGTPVAGQAVKLLFDLGEGGAVVETVAGVGSPEATDAALAVLGDAAASLAVRQSVVAGLGKHPEGQRRLLGKAQEGSLDVALREAVAAVLATSTDEAVRSAAESVIPMQAASPLPAVAELAKRSGDAG